MTPWKLNSFRCACKASSGYTIARASCVLLALAFAASAPLQAESEQDTMIDGRCEYQQHVVEFRNETTLILCTKVKITHAGTKGALEFAQASGPPTEIFFGTWSGDQLSISAVTLRNGQSFSTSGTCKIFRRNDGRIAVISCLTPPLPRSVAANFVPSRL